MKLMNASTLSRSVSRRAMSVNWFPPKRWMKREKLEKKVLMVVVIIGCP